ncbi:hypothetical protein Micbo1qcDRAFT_194177 [Microdochium bolleyi]|uniref:DUF6590 domain-containing protein n=1 Tax=Microdochium bolleyi TaxID=196109 RepID=A0A136J6L5_9PEZI|nr:hypothetical protein Micbo1qcDRAFT_194177 [Microdochium bolleyi]
MPGPGHNFAVQRSKRFHEGAVFKAMWIQPKGSHSIVTEPSADPHYEGIRRFIVVTTQSGHSNCVAIFTYQGYGCLKGGSHPEFHGQAYDDRYGVPALLEGEPHVGFAAIPVTILPDKARTERIDDVSRINFSKLYTVEHNIPVQFIGYLGPDSLEYLISAVQSFFVSRRQGSGKGKGKGRK